MNILIFTHEFPPALGGAGVVAKEYATSLSSVGHAVTVLTKYRENATYDHKFKVHQVKTIKKLWFMSYRNALDFDSYDLIILNDVNATFTASLFFSKANLSKSIMMLHGSEPENIFLRPGLYRRIFCFKYFYKHALSRVNKIVAVSNFMKSKFLKYTKLDYLSDKIEILPNFIDHKIFYPQPDPTLRSELGLPDDSFLLVTAARIIFGKGYLEKLCIFEQLVMKGDKNLYWLIAGDGNDMQKLKNEVTRRQLADRVLFLGLVPRNELVRIYSSADLFWMLSNFEEALPLVYIESQACGCPAMGRNAAGSKETILNGKTGYLVDNEKHVMKIFDSPEFLEFDKRDLINFSQSFNANLLVKYVNNLRLKK